MQTQEQSAPSMRAAQAFLSGAVACHHSDRLYAVLGCFREMLERA